MPDIVQLQPLAPSDAERLDDEGSGETRCSRVRGHLDAQRVTLWIDRRSKLLLRQDRESEVDGKACAEITTH